MRDQARRRGVSLRCLGMGGEQGSLLQRQRRAGGSRRSHGPWTRLRAGPSDTQPVHGTLQHFASSRPSCGHLGPGASLLLSTEGLERHNPCRAVSSALHGRRPSAGRALLLIALLGFGVPERFRASRSEEGVSQIELDHRGALGGRSFVEPAPTNRRRIAANAPVLQQGSHLGKTSCGTQPDGFRQIPCPDTR